MAQGQGASSTALPAGPATPRPKRFGTLEFTDRVRVLLRAWPAWLVLAVALHQAGFWFYALPAMAMSLLLYLAATPSHPAIYPLESTLDVDSAEFQNTMEGVTGMPFIAGQSPDDPQQRRRILPGDARCDRIGDRNRSPWSSTSSGTARWAGASPRRFAVKARDGVPVKLLLDAIGSATLGPEIFRILEAGGCQLAWFHPIHWYTLDRANRRDHRKSLIVDGRVAFTGGAGIGDHGWAAQARRQSGATFRWSSPGPARWPSKAASRRTGWRPPAKSCAAAGSSREPRREGDVKVQTILSSPSDRRRRRRDDVPDGAAMRAARAVHREPVLHSRRPRDRHAGGGRGSAASP